MLHLGDITKIKGCVAPVVDCIIGGSPCQDLSVAGKRAGLAGERSGLYMEQIRIIKEMRHKDAKRGRTGQSIRPRYMVWENVPGAFSSNQGKDFSAVIEEAIRVAEPQAPDVPVPEKGWPTSGCIMGDNWSVAWRVLDAQFWGVPQRRRRIALVADFGGQSASEILFVRKGVSRDIDESEQERKETSGDAENRIGADDQDGTSVPVTLEPGIAAREGGHIYEGVSGTLRAKAGDNQMAVAHTICIEGNGSRPSHKGEGYIESDTMYTLNTLERHGVAYSIENHPADSRVNLDESGKVQTLTSRMGTGGGNVPMVMESVTLEPCYVDTSHADDVIRVDDVTAPLQARDYKGGKLVCTRYIVRRLTPLECERLQGYPDGWTDIGEWVDSNGKKHKEADSPRYKALGNSIAIPPWKWVLKRLCACYERDATMASLFDGIGGFPYIWEQLNGKGSCLWASEIEEFPIAVTKLRFGGSENG